MSTIYVGMPILQYSSRFHLDKGKRWNVLEHLVLQALTKKPRTASVLAADAELPRRVILEVLIRLMRAGWVELRAAAGEVTFYPTARGAAVAFEDDLPAVTQRVSRRLNFAVDLISGSIFRRRDLTLLWASDWRAKIAGHRAVEVSAESELPKGLGHVSSLFSALLDEDEHMVRVDVSDRPPAKRIALFTVRNGQIESLPTRASPDFQKVILNAARRASVGVTAAAPIHVALPSIPTQGVRLERATIVRNEDYVLGGPNHSATIENALRKARQFVIIHSTFVNADRFEALLPSFKVAADRGCKVDILWGANNISGGLVKSLAQVEIIRKRIGEAGLSGRVEVHRPSTDSHAKLLVYDDGAGATHAVVGSCNWLYSGFDSFEASMRLKDPRLVADVLFELAEMVRPKDGQLPDLTVRFAQIARNLASKQPLHGSTRVKLVTGQEHDDCVLLARDTATSNITVMSHRLGVTAKPAIIIPTATAVRERQISVNLMYGVPSGPVEQADANAAAWEFKEEGVTLTAVQKPRIHAKLLLWDDDHTVISSLNWLSADVGDVNPRGEIGVSINGARSAAYIRNEIAVTRSLVN